MHQSIAIGHWFCYNQLEQKFYLALLAWEFQQDQDRDYYLILNTARMNVAILKMTEEIDNMPSVWMVYFNVEDLEATIDKVTANGGAIHMKGIAEGVGDFAVVADPQGASFYIMSAPIPDTGVEN